MWVYACARRRCKLRLQPRHEHAQQAWTNRAAKRHTLTASTRDLATKPARSPGHITTNGTPVIVALMSNWSGRHIHDSSTTTGIKTVPCKRTLTNDSTSMETVSREHAITRITRAADPNAKAFPDTAVVLPAASGVRWEPGPAQQVATSQQCRSVV